MMTQIHRKFIYALLLLAFVPLLSGCSQDGFTYQVNDVASDPGAFTGALNIVGVVSAYSPTDATLIGIMDKKELQCTTPNCNKAILPVRYQGERPALGDEVQVSGSFVNQKLFQADTLKVLANHNLGGQG